MFTILMIIFLWIALELIYLGCCGILWLVALIIPAVTFSWYGAFIIFIIIMIIKIIWDVIW